MVISDFYETKKNQIIKLQAAHLMDRFFSFLIDCIVISPFVMFFLSIAFNDGYLFLKGHRQAPEQNLLFIISSLSYVMCFSFIQSLFIVFYKATPGQYFLKVQMQFNENQSGLFLRAFLRQVFFWLSLCFLGLPFLSVMTNKERRTFYDRITDINVVTKKIETDFFSFEKEFRYWQSLMSTIVVFAVFLVSAFIWSYYTKIVNRNLSFSKLEESHFFCDDLNGVGATNRLGAAVGLNLVGHLSDECLNSEADFVLWKEKKSDISLAYYAKSLTAKQHEVEKKYLEKACAVDSVSMGCKLSMATLKDGWNELYASIENDSLLNSILKYEIALQYKNINEIQLNFTNLEKFNTLKLVKKYQINEILQNKNYESSRSPASFKATENDQQKLLLELIEGL